MGDPIGQVGILASFKEVAAKLVTAPVSVIERLHTNGIIKSKKRSTEEKIVILSQILQHVRLYKIILCSLKIIHCLVLLYIRR